MDAMMVQATRVLIPVDGQEHTCPCDEWVFSAWDGDGWLRKPRVVTDEGVMVDECPGCGRELEAVVSPSAAVKVALRDDAPSCPFHDDRAQVRNGMCGSCAEKADDAR